jgi:hypothetical protein
VSSYSAAQVRFNADLGPDESGVDRVRAAVLHDLARTITVPAAITLRQLESTWAAVAAAVPRHATLLTGIADAEFQRARHLTQQARISMAGAAGAPDHLAAAAAAQLRAALLTGASELGRQERLLVATIAERACGHLGYLVTRHDGRTTTGLEARLDHEILLMSVANQGAVEVDHAGLVDAACLDRQADLEREMSRLGADLVTTDRVTHGDRRGGALIAAAAGRGRESLAHGVVGATEAHGPYGSATRPAASLRREDQPPR